MPNAADSARYPVIPWPRVLEPRAGELAQSDDVTTRLDPSIEGDEAYVLDVTPESAEMRARTDRGLYYARQTLRQLSASGRVPCVRIQDAPRLRYRGLHLDVGRYFCPVEFIKKYVDVMSAFKLNTFHWHLAEDQGWRLEIKKYPKLTEVGAYRKETIVG